MMRPASVLIRLFCRSCCLLPLWAAAAPPPIVLPAQPSPDESLAAREVRRYVYLRSGELLSIHPSSGGADQAYILVARKEQPEIKALAGQAAAESVTGLKPQEYLLRKTGPRSLLIVGGDDVGVLYGAYGFAEKLGVRFYLHGDVAPDGKARFSIPELNETARPLFALRGLQPFHDFAEGPDWWTRQDWLGIVAQAAKMRLNFIGLHTYPFHKVVGSEPTVWVGLPEDVNADGTVKTSDVATWYNTERFLAYGLYTPGKTSAFSFGGAEVFPTDDYGAEVNGPEDFPIPKTPAANVALMDRTGEMLRAVFDEAHRLGMKTCVGTESPLAIPDVLQAQLQEAGLDPAAPATVQKLYAGMFTRIQRAYPIDYYWIWGHEGKVAQERFITDLECAHAALEETKAPFGLGLCGWGWITGNFPALDKALPRDVAFSSLNMNGGETPVSPNFAALGQRPRWAIPWCENDGYLTSLQLWVGRVRKDAADALQYGCNGLMGLHWRTRVMGPNIAALAHAAWDQSGWNKSAPGDRQAAGGGPRFLPAADFYADWARTEFGPGVAQPAAALFTKLDGNVPFASYWIRGPGVVVINRQPWARVAPRHAYVEEMAALRPRVQGAGNLERFDWWLNTLRFNRAMARLGCARGALDVLMEKIAKEPDPAVQQRLAREQALPQRLELVRLLADMYGDLLATLNNVSELGTIANIELQSMLRTKLITVHDAELQQLLGGPLPADAQPWQDYRGPARLVVLTARGSQRAGEAMPLRIIALDRQPAKSLVVHVRQLGRGQWTTLPAKRLARAVYETQLPRAQDNFEYYVTASLANGKKLNWPATAPALNQTVVITE